MKKNVIFLIFLAFFSILVNYTSFGSKVASVVKQSIPSVVCINCVGKTNANLNPFAGDPFFSFFFGTQSYTHKSSGSGVIVDPNGYIITCAHVVAQAETIKVTLSNNVTFKAKVVLSDESMDLAVLKLELKDKNIKLPFLKIAQKNIEVGDSVIAIGNSFGVGQTVTHGIISAVYRTFGERILSQTDAPINPGNSGGPIITEEGEIAGIANAIATRSGASHGVGFFIPGAAAYRILNRAINGEETSYLPIKVQTADSSIIETLNENGIGITGGITIISIDEGYRTELEPGDVIISFSGQEIFNKEMLDFFVSICPVNTICQTSFIKAKDVTSNEASKIRTVALKIKERPKNKILSESQMVIKKVPLENVVVAEITPEIVESLSLKINKGVIVLQTPRNSQIVKKGDIILELNGKTIIDIKNIEEALNTKQAGFSITIQRGNTILQQQSIIN